MEEEKAIVQELKHRIVELLESYEGGEIFIERVIVHKNEDTNENSFRVRVDYSSRIL